MVGSELILILALSAILVLLRLQQKKISNTIEAAGSGLDRGPVRSRPAEAYAPSTAEAFAPSKEELQQ